MVDLGFFGLTACQVEWGLGCLLWERRLEDLLSVRCTCIGGAAVEVWVDSLSCLGFAYVFSGTGRACCVFLCHACLRACVRLFTCDDVRHAFFLLFRFSREAWEVEDLL